MRLVRAFAGLAIVCSLASTTVALTAGCGGGGAKSAAVKQGPMPEGESWTGVYFHPVYGYLHMEENEANIRGKWQRSDKSAWGELSGTKQGNVAHFSWKEYKSGVVGGAQSGKGYFVYTKTEDMEQAQLKGEYGLGRDETGSEWNMVKQARMAPDLKSIGGDTGGSAPVSGGLD
jgi:hypothetical protein